MGTTTTQSPQLQAHFEICDQVNAKIIERLEKGTVPWYKTWSAAGIPRNVYSGKDYQGINLLLLVLTGYEQNLFITYKQLQQIGGKVKKGEHGHIVCHWQYPENQEQLQPEQESKQKGLLKRYVVFNVAQCEDIPEGYLTKHVPPKEYPACEAIVKGMPNCPVIRHKETEPTYDPVKDLVHMPRKSSFEIEEVYYSVLFHLLVHSTGHGSRLDRKCLNEKTDFTTAQYVLEDFIADFGRWYLDSYVGNVPFELKATTEYLNGWIKAMKADKWLIFKATSYAHKAVSYILGNKDTE